MRLTRSSVGQGEKLDMRVSKISQDTAKLMQASAPTRITRNRQSALLQFAHNAAIAVTAGAASSERLGVAVDIEDSLQSSRKRKRERSPRSPKKTVVKIEMEENVIYPTPRVRRLRKPARPITNEETGNVEILPPNDWAEVYSIVKTMRIEGNARNAAVDIVGCEKLGLDTVPPRVKRFHTLTALMLSSQTKDTTNAIAMKRLQTELPAHKKGEPSGLTLENILAVDPKLLNELIWVVGFHNNKTKFIKATAKILRDVWEGDIPDTVEGLISLPGVGPKMAYLVMSSAWGRHEGIGVDTHVHRISNLWGWHKTKGPEETRLSLQAWLPKELWHEINWLLVGLGQTICLPVGRKCEDCDLGLRGLCRGAERSKVTRGRKVKEQEVGKDEAGHIVNTIEIVDSQSNTDKLLASSS